MDDKGVHFGLVISDLKLLVLLGIVHIAEGFGIVVDRDFNTGIFSRKRLVVCVCKSQVLTDLLIQLRSNTVVLNILRNFDLVKKSIRRPGIGHFGIKPPSRGVLIITGRGKAAGGFFPNAPFTVVRRNILSGSVILTVYLDGGIVMHLLEVAVSVFRRGRYIGKLILLAIGIIGKGIGKPVAFFVRRNVTVNNIIFVFGLGQLNAAFDLGTPRSDRVYDRRTLQVLTIRVLDGHSPCDLVGVGIIRTGFRDAIFKFSRRPLPIVFIVGTRFILKFNLTDIGDIVLGHLNTIGQLITLAGLQ